MRIPLHQARDAQGFLAAFEQATGRSVRAFLADFAAPGGTVAVALGGSIPLGIATEASDVDLLVLLESKEALLEPPPGAPRAAFAGTFATPEELAVGTAVIRQPGVEIDVQFLLAPRLAQLMAMSKTSRIALTFQQRQLVARLRKGWLLDPGSWPASARDLHDESFDLHCAVQSMTTSFRSLADARAAAQDHWRLALAMGRHSVEKAFEAYFASRGYSSLGLKWLRFLDRRWEDITGEGAGQMPPALATRGQDLLLPAGAPEAVPGYLAEVERFTREVRKVIEGSLRFKVALEVSPFMARPRVSGGQP